MKNPSSETDKDAPSDDACEEMPASKIWRVERRHDTGMAE